MGCFPSYSSADGSLFRHQTHMHARTYARTHHTRMPFLPPQSKAKAAIPSFPFSCERRWQWRRRQRRQRWRWRQRRIPAVEQQPIEPGGASPADQEPNGPRGQNHPESATAADAIIVVTVVVVVVVVVAFAFVAQQSQLRKRRRRAGVVLLHFEVIVTP